MYSVSSGGFIVWTITLATRLGTVVLVTWADILECVLCDSQLWASTKLYLEYSNNPICYKGWEVYLGDR